MSRSGQVIGHIAVITQGGHIAAQPRDGGLQRRRCQQGRAEFDALRRSKCLDPQNDVEVRHHPTQTARAMGGH